ncbi:hypothetical protein OAN72_00130 [bacterium]|nr:hypothetical protein [bacterium]
MPFELIQELTAFDELLRFGAIIISTDVKNSGLARGVVYLAGYIVCTQT